MIACIARGQPPADAAVALEPGGFSYAILEESGRCLWWHYAGSRLIIDDITERPDD